MAEKKPEIPFPARVKRVIAEAFSASKAAAQLSAYGSDSDRTQELCLSVKVKLTGKESDKQLKLKIAAGLKLLRV
jgi:hypothetical protein